jgi:HPt (histidine-containing phosphotransfer) domain-containing protein
MAAPAKRQAHPDEIAEGVRQRFLERSAADLILVCAYPDGVSRAELSFVAHRLAGAAGVFGFPALSDAAAALEMALAEHTHDSVLPTRPLTRILVAMLAD